MHRNPSTAPHSTQGYGLVASQTSGEKKSYPIDSIFIIFNIDVYKGEKTPSGLL